MLGEGFLRVLLYREERKFSSRGHRAHTHSQCADAFNGARSEHNSADRQAEAGANQEGLDPTQPKGRKEVSHAPAGRSIPGCSPALQLDPDFTVCIDNCSLLEHYPDLQVADSGRISNSTHRAATPQHGLHSQVQHPTVQQKPQHGRASPIPDQGYLVMGPSVNISLDLPGSGLEPMSNSVLNGLLDKQLEEFWMQHFTDNLARCNSHLGNSLLHGLVQPPQPCSHQQGPDSLEPSLGEGPEDSKEGIRYLSTQNVGLCSSNFSSPVLRISEADNPLLQ